MFQNQSLKQNQMLKYSIVVLPKNWCVENFRMTTNIWEIVEEIKSIN